MPSTEHIHHLFLEVTTSQYFVLCTLGPQTFQHEGQVLWETEGEGGGRRSLRELASSRFLTGRGPVPGVEDPCATAPAFSIACVPGRGDCTIQAHGGRAGVLVILCRGGIARSRALGDPYISDSRPVTVENSEQFHGSPELLAATPCP